MRRNGHAVIIATVATIHVYWGALLGVSSGALLATPIAGLYDRIHDQRVLGLLLIVAGIAAIAALTRSPSPATLALMFPQQLALLASCYSCLTAATSGVYADGTRVPGGWVHISVDQAPLFAWVVAHGVAYGAYHWPRLHE